jgi:hypothetical protein
MFWCVQSDGSASIAALAGGEIGQTGRFALPLLVVVSSCPRPLCAAVAGVLSAATIAMAKTKKTRHGLEMSVFSQQLESPGFKK